MARDGDDGTTAQCDPSAKCSVSSSGPLLVRLFAKLAPLLSSDDDSGPVAGIGGGLAKFALELLCF